jgi:hypothetical protein
MLVITQSLSRPLSPILQINIRKQIGYNLFERGLLQGEGGGNIISENMLEK